MEDKIIEIIEKLTGFKGMIEDKEIDLLKMKY